jgi:hypothetical protein
LLGLQVGESQRGILSREAKVVNGRKALPFPKATLYLMHSSVFLRVTVEWSFPGSLGKGCPSLSTLDHKWALILACPQLRTRLGAHWTLQGAWVDDRSQVGRAKYGGQNHPYHPTRSPQPQHVNSTVWWPGRR